MKLIRIYYKASERELTFTVDFKDLQSLSSLKSFEKDILAGQFNTKLERADSLIEYDGSFKARIEFKLTHTCELAEGMHLMQSVSKELLKLKELTIDKTNT